jgi:hypothetical protein
MIVQTERAKQIEATPVDELARQLFSFADFKADVVPIYYMAEDGETLKFRFHKYQKQAMKANERFILLLGGTQSGKTSFGPIWLHREMCLRGAGDYIAVAPTYPLMSKKMLPEFVRFFKDTLQLGEYKKADKMFIVSKAGEIDLFGEEQETPTVIHFGHAQDPDALESATAKAAWLDECGQTKFKLDSFEAIVRRLSLYMGRVLMTTTPYNLGWLKQKFWDIWQRSRKEAKKLSLRVISFPSIANPSFPRQVYETARQTLQKWKFDMFYRAIFTRPAGMIYDCFDEAVHKIKRFPIPDHWPRYLGLDFGGVNTAGVFIAQELDNENEPTGGLIAYREYHAGGRTAKQHAEALRRGEPMLIAYGGAKSEGQWRDEFSAAGLYVGEPAVSDVEVGINRVYGALKRLELRVFDDLDGLNDEMVSYSRELDDMGEPTEKIADKETFHRLDGLRYVISRLKADYGPLVLW